MDFLLFLWSIVILCGILIKLMWLTEICLNDTYSNDHVDTNLYYTFRTQINMKKGDTLWSLLIAFHLYCSICLD
jgi:hypothetical protein